MIRIDAHQHFWQVDAPWLRWPGPDLPAIRRTFLPEDLEGDLRDARIDGTVLVQSQPRLEDTDWLLRLANAAPRVLAVVGWVDMLDEGAPATIARLAADPLVKGLRPMLQDLPPSWILQAQAAPALDAMERHGLVLDALIRPAHLFAITALADERPDLSIAIDHAAKPGIASGDIRGWAGDIALLAERRNVWCKLSGLVTEAAEECSPSDIAPYVDVVLTAFGADRVLWGSDWPVVLLRTGYASWLATARALVPAPDHAAVFGGTAAKLYRIEQPGRSDP